MSKPAAAGVVFVLVVLAVIIYSTVSLTRNRVRVEACMEFNGRRDCRTASGENRDATLRAAVSTACAMIASGVGDTTACERSNPVSVRWLK